MTIALVLLIGGLAGGAWGWWIGTRSMRAPGAYDLPIGEQSKAYVPRTRRRLRRRRFYLVIGSAVATPLLLLGALTFFAVQR